ncbi:MAG: M4 family metallopeptidase [Steroidobacteraceae bacterium]
MRLPCGCFIVPRSVLERFAQDRSLRPTTRQAFARTRDLDPIWRQLRCAHTEAAQARLLLIPCAELATTPLVTVYTCDHSTSLPGAPIAKPGSSSDDTAQRAFRQTTAVARFYKNCFDRNSVDDAGMTLMSSIHYGQKYNNAFWNGSQMTYGDGDGQIFVDFTRSNDVIGHELTHGVTQYTAGLGYEDQPGALNESISDVFGSMFRQWQAKQSVKSADWLIGSGIMGPAAKSKGYRCLRSMAEPGAAICLSPQPARMKDYEQGGDPHTNSGIPNRAFYLVAMGIGGRSWEKAGKIWYAALTSPKATQDMNFKAFAKLTKSAATRLFPGDSKVAQAVKAGWKGVGISIT